MVGRTISHFEIVEKLGEGGMGVVYKARDTHLDRFVAIKVLPPEKVADAERKRRFVQEAKSASALNHPNIITIYDISSDEGIDFIAMEYVAGKALNELIARKRLPLGEALKYAVQIADALAAAHAAGIIHRDLKPGNVMVGGAPERSGSVKVLDFGVAKLTDRLDSSDREFTETMRHDDAPATGEGAIVGTVFYMSPEQAEGKTVDGRSDIFSFGALLYEMVTGRRAFHGDSKLSTLSAILREEQKPASQVVEGLPRDLERIIARCLRKSPERRFQTMADLKVALEELKEESDSGTLSAAPAPQQRPARRLVWALALLAIIAAGLGTLRFIRSPAEPPEAALNPTPLTTYRGFQVDPSFSPDGNQVAFAWNGDLIHASSPDVFLSDVFVTKLDHSGNVVFTTTFGGKALDQANAIALDASGNIWIGGSTFSSNFPLHDALQTNFVISGTGFLVKLAPEGTVIYSSYFGGTLGASSVTGVATDQTGNLYVTGMTFSSDFPITPGMPAGKVAAPLGNGGTSGAFITKLSPNGLQILYSGLIVGNTPVCQGGSSCFLSTRSTSGAGISVDSAGSAYVAGNTNTSDLPVSAGAFLATGYGAFAAKVNATGNGLVYLTYLGPPAGIVTSFEPSESIMATAITIDSSGNAYLAGYTNDPEFPATSEAFQTTLEGPDSGSNSNDAFVAKLNTTGTALVWATYLGGPQADQGNSLSIDASENVWLAGTAGGGFPSASKGVTIGPGDFLAELKSDGSALTYSTIFAIGSVGQAIAVDTSGLLHVAGLNGLVSIISPLQPPTARIFGITNAAAGPFSGRLSPGELISIYGPGIGPSTAASGTPNPSGLYPKSLGGVQVLIDGIAAPLLYVSRSQINAQVPFSLTDPDNSTISITNGSLSIPVFRASVDPAIPGIFNNAGSAAAVNQDGTLNTTTNPAKQGSIVSIWVTGTGVVFGAIDGQVATAAANICIDCEISVNGVASANGFSLALYAGAAPGIINGVSQINFIVPSLSGLYMNQAPVTLTIGTAVSPTTILYVAQ